MRDEFVQIREGRFQLKGKKWSPFGVNYLPRYAINLPVSGGLHWYDPLVFDKKIIKEDLSMIADMGCTAVSIQVFCSEYHFSPWFPTNLRRFQNSQVTLLDSHRKYIEEFLGLCDRYGLKVDIHCIGSDPLYFNEQAIRSAIVDSGFWQNPTIYSWALSWEPHFGLHYERRIWDKDWNDWILNAYEDFEQAFKKWDCKAEITDNGIISPQDHMIRKAGPWEKMILDYESFLWDLASDRYSKVSKIIRQMAPSQLVFARTVGIVGIPETEPNEDILFYIPIEKISKDVDYVAFEWWVEPSNIIYSKWAANDKPVVCQEFGFNLSGYRLPVLPNFDVGGLNYKQALERQAATYSMWYETMLDNGVDGAFLWFWPGGARKDEGGSDFGIVEPDGTARPVCEVVRKYSELFTRVESISMDHLMAGLKWPDTGYYTDSWPLRYNRFRKQVSTLLTTGMK